MTQYFVEIIFENVDLEADNIDKSLSRANIEGAENFESHFVILGASLEAPTALAAAKNLIKSVRAEVPAATPVRVARNLVNVPEIAERIGVSRQTVRNWVDGKRRDGSFPMPIDNDGNHGIWEWGAVNAWLRFNLGLDDGLYYPTPLELGEIDGYIKSVREGRIGGSLNVTSMLKAFGHSPNLLPLEPTTMPVTIRFYEPLGALDRLDDRSAVFSMGPQKPLWWPPVFAPRVIAPEAITYIEADAISSWVPDDLAELNEENQTSESHSGDSTNAPKHKIA